MKPLIVSFPAIPPARPAPSLSDEIEELTCQIDALRWKRDFMLRALAREAMAAPSVQPLSSPRQDEVL